MIVSGPKYQRYVHNGPELLHNASPYVPISVDNLEKEDVLFRYHYYCLPLYVLKSGVSQSDISIGSILAFSAGSGYRSDETDPNPILCIYHFVLLLCPTKATKTS